MNDRADTKTKILDAAEKLFGMKGFEATSLRDITAEAQVNLAAVNYHFQSKDSLIDAVIARRFDQVNQRRFQMLDELGPKPQLEGILRAFFAPILDTKIDPVVPLLGRIMSEPNQFVERVFYKHISPVAQRFGLELARAVPDLSPAERQWRMYFVAGVLTHLLSWSQVFPVISGGLCDMTDRHAVVERAVAFLAAGFRSAPLDLAGLSACPTMESMA